MSMKNMFFKKVSGGASAGKIIFAVLLTLCCTVSLTFTVSAAENNEIRLNASGSEAVLELYFPQVAAEEIASMQVSVCVKVNSDGVDLEFIPDSGLASKIVESRYHSDTGVLNIYLAGTEALFPSSGSVTVGKIKINSSGSAASATVSAVKDSVKFVSGGELVSPDNDIDYPGTVSISVSGQSSSGTQDPVYPNYPSGNYFPNISVPTVDIDHNGANNGDDRNNESSGNDLYGDDEVLYSDDDESGQDRYGDTGFTESDTLGDDPNLPDVSALSEAISRAESYNKADYTESSYNNLKKAINRAKTLISDPDATREEIDEALLNIENAIGMLQLINDIPSGAEGYGQDSNMVADETDNGFFAENSDGSINESEHVQNGQPSDRDNTGNSADDVQAAQDINSADSSEDVRSAYNNVFSENEGSGKKFAVLTVIPAAAAAIVAVIIIVFKRVKIKKNTDGEHFNTKL